MGRRKKEEVSGALSMKSKTNPEAFESNDEEQLETLASEESELLEADSEETEEAAPAKPKRQRRPRKKAEPKKIVAEESDAKSGDKEALASEPQGPTEIDPAAQATAEVCPLPSMGGAVPQSVAEATVSSRVLNQMVNQITDSAANGTADANALKKQLTAVKEVSVTICSQLDRMSAAMMELQSKHAAAIQDLTKDKSAPKASAKIPLWMVATSGLALLLSVVSFSLTQATRHAVLGGHVAETVKTAPAATPSQVFGAFTKNAVAQTETTKPTLPGPRPLTAPSKAPKAGMLAKKEGTSRRNHH